MRAHVWAPEAPTFREVSSPCLFLFSFYYYHYYFFIISGCADKNSKCARWAKSGYCTGRYENYMKINCAKSCKQCGGGGGGNGSSCKILCTLYVILSHKLILGRKRKKIYHNRALSSTLLGSVSVGRTLLLSHIRYFFKSCSTLNVQAFITLLFIYIWHIYIYFSSSFPCFVSCKTGMA